MFFCNKANGLWINGSTFQLDKHIGDTAIKKQDFKTLTKLNSASDIIALQMKYYKVCLVA